MPLALRGVDARTRDQARQRITFAHGIGLAITCQDATRQVLGGRQVPHRAGARILTTHHDTEIETQAALCTHPQWLAGRFGYRGPIHWQCVVALQSWPLGNLINVAAQPLRFTPSTHEAASRTLWPSSPSLGSTPNGDSAQDSRRHPRHLRKPEPGAL